MLEKSYGLLFFLKQPKNQEKEALRMVYLRITIDGISRELSTKRQWDPARWNQKAGRASGNKEDAKTLNVHLDVLSSKVFVAETHLLNRSKDITAEAIKNIMLGEGDDRKMVMEIFKAHNDKMKTLIGIDYAAGTMQRFQTSFDHTRNFILSKYGKEDIPLNQLDYEFISDYFYWLKTVRKCGQNSALKYLSNFRKIVGQCVLKGWLPRDPFLSFKASRKEVQKIALTNDELDRIKDKKFDTERLNLVCDIFRFSCYTGLAYADVKKLRNIEIIKGDDGEKWIVTKRQKTKSPTRIPLLPVAAEIAEKYDQHPRCLAEGYVLPVFTNQKVNEYLKEIAALCGIHKTLTFHIARHTFATTITLGNGVPIETVSKMLGHSNIKQTQHYAKVLDLKVSQDMQILRGKLSSNGSI